MPHVACLTCSPDRPALDGALLERLRGGLPGAGEPRWLRPGVAAEIPFETRPGADLPGLAAGLRGEVQDLPVDVNLVSRERRLKRLLVADMDSTIIEQECIDELAGIVGLKEEVAAITERAMRGEIPFESALEERVALLKGVPLHVVDDLLDSVITLTPGAATMVATMKAHGAYTCLISGGFTVFTQAIAARVGFDEQRANRLVVSGGAFAGEVEKPILGRAAKRDGMLELAASLAIGSAEAMAVGDGANDLAMIQEAGAGVAFRAKPAVAEAAPLRILYGDLTALLHLQGIGFSDFNRVT